MTYKSVRYSDHATKKRRKAGATRTQVRETIINGRPSVTTSIVGPRLNAKVRRFGQRDLEVVYLEGPRGIYVITLWWVAEFAEDQQR